MTRPVGQKEPEKYIKVEKGKRPVFKKGNPGRPEGSKNKVTLLKEKILVAALSRDLNGNRQIVIGKGKKKRIILIPEVSTVELMKVGATFVPKELKGEGFGSRNVTIIYPGLKNERQQHDGDNRLHPTAKAKNLSRKSEKI